MRGRWKKLFLTTSLATKIRLSYILLSIPLILLLCICLFNMQKTNQEYEDMLNSASVASEFSVDFKKDFDYETYLLVVGNKTIEESKLGDLLYDANRVVNGLIALTNSEPNQKRLQSAKKYLANLAIYKNRIEENIKTGNRYEDNMLIWENDVLIVTDLMKETIFQYIYYEVKELQETRNITQSFYEQMIRIVIVSFIAILALIMFLSIIIPRSISKPIVELGKVTDQVARGNLEVRATVAQGSDISDFASSLNTMIDKINELLLQVKEEQIHLHKAELELLQSQINPHFLYNTLDTIIWLSEAGDQKSVVNMVKSLSDFFRTALSRGRDMISIKEELVHVQSYLMIQQVRYQDIMEFEIDVPNCLYNYSIPKISIQPLVENALYHGVKNKRGKGKIRIRGEKKDKCFLLYVEDNGIGMQPEKLAAVQAEITNKKSAESTIYGLYNVNERIALQFGKEYGIQIDSKYKEGTIITICLPYVEAIPITLSPASMK